MFETFQTKLIVTFAALFAAVQVVTFIAVGRAVRTNFYNQAEAQLSQARQIFKRHLDRQGDQLAEAARVLAGDFGFRQAVADRDRPTIRSALDNHGSRIGADRAMLVSLEGRLLADTRIAGETAAESPDTPRSDSGGAFPFADLLERAERDNAATALVVLDDRFFEVALVPVEAPLPIAWIVIGKEVNDAAAQSLQAMLPQGLDITFLRETVAGRWKPAASTLESGKRRLLPPRIEAVTAAGQSPTTVGLEGETYVSLSARLDTPPGSAPAMAVLQYSLTQALASYRGLIVWMAGITAGGLVLVLLGSVWVTRNVSKPIHALVAAAGRIRRGDYAEPVPIPTEREFGQLAHSVNAMMSGIAEREARIAHQARHDPLTGFANRDYFETRLTETAARFQDDNRAFSIVIVGLERLPEINVTLGHAIGDALLTAAAERLAAFVPNTEGGDSTLDPDTRIAVHSTGTFILLVPDTGPDQAVSAANRILEDLDRPFSVGEINVDAGPHLGIACFPHHGGAAKAVLQRAEIALYVAREENSRCTIYSNDQESTGHAHLSLMGELREGLERDELTLHYQPKLDLANDRLLGAEALVRWNHPKNGFMTPGEFIPLAERTGQIDKVTRWCLDRALAECAAWRQAGKALITAVNLSARDLAMTDLSEFVRRKLTEYDLPAAALTLEITESAVMHDPETAFRTLRALNAQGLAIAVDDFGTGYSSLEYLRKLPVHELKIDKGFVLNLAVNAEDRIIVRSIIDLGHNLGLRVTAEGVEDPESLDQLRRLKCDAVQGFFIAEPLVPAAFDDFVAGHPEWLVSTETDRAMPRNQETAS